VSEQQQKKTEHLSILKHVLVEKESLTWTPTFNNEQFEEHLFCATNEMKSM